MSFSFSSMSLLIAGALRLCRCNHQMDRAPGVSIALAHVGHLRCRRDRFTEVHRKGHSYPAEFPASFLTGVGYPSRALPEIWQVSKLIVFVSIRRSLETAAPAELTGKVNRNAGEW